MEPKTELQRNASVAARRRELDSYQRALDIQWLDSRMEDGRMGRSLALIQKEAEMEKDFKERTDHAAIVNARAQRETALSAEVAKVHHEEACQLLRRHYLRERDPSLRELAKKLQAGYVCRDLKLQMQNNEYRRLQEKAEERRANTILTNSLYNNQTAFEKEDREKTERSSKYCKELQQQLINKQRQKQCQFEDMLIEKKMLDDIMRTISDEDQRELQQKRSQREKMRREMVTFTAARDAWRRKQALVLVDEERNIELQRRGSADRAAARVAERERKLRVKDELNQKVTDKILADEADRLERENIIKSLQEQEYLEKNAQDDIAERLKLERVRTETKRALTAQMETRKKLQADHRAREEEFRKETEAKMELENEREREKERQRREKKHKYALELQQQIADNARRRGREQELEEGRAKHVWDCDRAWRREVAEERTVLLQEHAPVLVGALRPGVLDTLELDSLGATTKVKRHPKCNAQCRVIREY